MTEPLARQPGRNRVRDGLVSAVLMILVVALYVWVDPLISGGPARPRSGAQWVTRIAVVLAFYGGLVWVMGFAHRALHGEPPVSLLPASKRPGHARDA